MVKLQVLFRGALAGAAVVLCACALTPPLPAPEPQPQAPYYSIEFGKEASREAALARLKDLGPVENLRVEARTGGWYLRAGSWSSFAEAARAREAHGANRVLRVDNPVPWLLVDGRVAAVAARPVPPEGPTQPAPTQPIAPYYSIEFGEAATREEALARLKELGPLDYLRAEERGSSWWIRAGSWPRLEDAERALFVHKETAQRALYIEESSRWLLPDGTTVEVPPQPPVQ